LIDTQRILAIARECGFELAGVAPALPLPEMDWYRRWVAAGFAGEMTYLTDRRGGVLADPRNLLSSARSVICLGKLYNGPQPRSVDMDDAEHAWISRYAWGDDYHDILRRGMETLAERLKSETGCQFDYRTAVDTAPLLERAYARQAGLGWIGKNGCLIHEGAGSWFFLCELLVSLDLAPGRPAPDRCGTCTRCIDACPTAAIVPVAGGQGPAFTVDSRLCISYFTIELRGPLPAAPAAAAGPHVFGCDICQDVCPWNRRAPVTHEPGFAARHFAPPLERLAAISEQEFRDMFRHSPVRRARYTGFLRNVATAMGNARLDKFRGPLERLAASGDAGVATAARHGLERLVAR
jgi:epoxyqueuosine reductase